MIQLLSIGVHVHCYNHTERDAVGSCKACSKGLCTECAVDLGHGLACRGAHEQRVTQLDHIISRNAQIQATAGRARYLAPIFLCFMGAVFTGYGLVYERRGNFTLLLGLGFLAYGVYAFAVNRRAFGKAEPMPDTTLQRTREG